MGSRMKHLFYKCRPAKYLLFALLPWSPAIAASDRILLVGDSHSAGAFGDGMAAAYGAQLHIYGVVGISAPAYLKDPVCGNGSCPWTMGYRTPKKTFPYGSPFDPKFPGLRSLLNDVDPKAVIVELGTNDAGNCASPTPAGSMLKMVQMIQQKGAACFWVGPPVYLRGSAPFSNCGERYNAYVDKLRDAINGAGCKFIDSRQIKDPRKTSAECAKPDNWKNPEPSRNCSIQNDADKYHFKKELGAVWAQGVRKQLP